MNLAQLSVHELLDVFRRREASPIEALDACAARIEEVDSAASAFVTLCVDRARAEARESEERWRRGDPRPLEGIPFGAKDLFASEGVRTTYGSPMFADHVPTEDAEAIRRTRAAGAVLVGKTQTHEFAWGITSFNRLLGSTRNPWAPDRISGGSSGGSAVALALDEVPLTLGSDTGGSIRVPSAFCGTVGLKPTWGRISAAGALPLARSLDHPGPMARTPADAALYLSVLAGVDPADPATEDVPLELGGLGGDLSGLRVAVCPDLHRVELAPDVARAFDDAVATVRSLGAEVVEVELPEAPLVYPTFVVVQRAEALRTHQQAGLYPARRAEYGDDVLGRLDAAAQVTLPDYLDALADRQRVRAGFARLFGAADLLLTPVSAGPPGPLGEDVVEHLGSPIEVRELVMSYTVPQDVTGIPACAVRAGFDSLGIPIGVQFSGPPWQEGRVLRAADAFFRATPELQSRRPELEAAWASS